MSYQDVSPQGQHFMNFSRPLTLRVAVAQAGRLTLELVYGFGEYRFVAVQALHDSLAELDGLATAMEAGAEAGEARFVDENGQVRLAVQGEGELLQFYCYDQQGGTATDVIPWLQGEAGRDALVAMLRAAIS